MTLRKAPLEGRSGAAASRPWPGARAGALTCLLVCWAATAAAGAIPPPEQLLPNDTLALVTAPDFPRLRQLWSQTPPARLWRDPALKAFRERWLDRCAEEWLKPLERDLLVQGADWAGLPQGQVTFAVLQNGWDGQSAASPAWVLVLDAKDQSTQLATNLATLRARWADAGKPWHAEKVRDVEFTVLTLSGNALRPLAGLLLDPAAGRAPDGGGTARSNSVELAVGQFQSALILSSSARAAEKVLARLSGTAAPALAEEATFEADRLAWFRNAPLYGWVNTKRLVEVWSKQPGPTTTADAPPALDAKQILTATGLTGLTSLALGLEITADALQLTLAAAAPEPTRSGLLKALSPQPKDVSPPAFVPADVAKFERLRLDGQQVWTTLEKVAQEISPVWGRAFNDFVAQANKDGSRTEAGFDLKRDLIGNLGDDLILWQKAPRAATPGDIEHPPALTLLGSPNAEGLARALGSLLAALAQSGPPKERDFLGRKIYSASAPLFGPPDNPQGTPPLLHYAASGGYVGLTTDEALLETWLRSGETPPKPLLETAGLKEAVAAAGGAGRGWLWIEDEAALVRPFFDLLRKEPATALELSPGGPWGAVLALTTAGAWIRWADFSLLPEWEAVSKHFYFSVATGGANAEGLCLRLIVPTPPALRAAP